MLEGPPVSAKGQGPKSESLHPTPPCVEIQQKKLNAFDLLTQVFDVILAARLSSMMLICTGKNVSLGVDLEALDPLKSQNFDFCLFFH